ncbi:MAG: DUF4276 family protein [Blastocatellia bacterium]
MVKGKMVRLYIEGGGNSESRNRLRKSFRVFLENGNRLFNDKSASLRIIFCGSKTAAYENFRDGLVDYPQALNFLLVDSDGPKELSQNCWQYLGWNSFGADEWQCHLMVQEIEAWFLADIEALRAIFRKKLNVKMTPNVEQLSNPKELLKKYTQDNYNVIVHAASLLETIDVAKVRQAAPHCERLFKTLTEKMI